MKCPSCGGLTRVLETREDRRRRACEDCGHRFSTVEVLLGARQAVAPPATEKAALAAEKTPAPTKEDKAKAKVAARRRLEEMRDRRTYAFNPFDEDSDFIPDKW